MTFKQSVTKDNVQPPVWYALGIAEMVYRYNGMRLVVTSMTDSHEHRPGSLHNKGLAVDIRTRSIPHDLLRSVHGSLVSVLSGLGFDVVLEKDHIHIEFQPKGPAEDWQRLEA